MNELDSSCLSENQQIIALCRLPWLYLRKVFALRTVFAAGLVISTGTTAPSTGIAGIKIFVHLVFALKNRLVLV